MPDFQFLSYLMFVRLKVTFKAIDSIILPEYKGSAFRGCLGETFRNKVCLFPGKPCRDCRLRFDCPFSRLYNSFTTPDHPHVRKFTKSPHPYIIDPLPGNQTFFEPGAVFGFEITLIGTAIQQYPLLADLFRQMGETGIGKQRGRFVPVKQEYLTKENKYCETSDSRIPEILSAADTEVPVTGSLLTLEFETPLRLKSRGKLAEAPPGFGLFAGRLAQRLGLLAHFHCKAPWQEFSTCKAENVTIYDSKLRWSDWQRYSGTQDTKMNFDGFVGTITWEGDVAPWMPLLTAGTWLHAGLTATFGLGKYQLVT